MSAGIESQESSNPAGAQRPPGELLRRVAADLAPPLVLLLVVVVGWQLTCSFAKVPRFLFPAPSDLVVALAVNLPLLGRAFLATLFEVAIAFAISIAVGISGAILLSTSRVLERSAYPYVILLQTVPSVATAPLIIIWFGATLTSVVIIAVMMAFVPILVNTLIGLRSTDRKLSELFLLAKASRIQTLLRLRFPAALPYIVTGLRISSTLAVIGAIVAEYISGIGMGSPFAGLGFVIQRSAQRLDTPTLFVASLGCALLGIGFYQLVKASSRLLLGSWHESERDAES
jgi:NitT/TauT family transport system permease protein